MRYGWFYIGISTFFMAVSAQGNELLQAKKVAAAERYIIAEVMLSQSDKVQKNRNSCKKVYYEADGVVSEGIVSLLGLAAVSADSASVEGLINLLGVKLSTEWTKMRNCRLAALLYGVDVMSQALQKASARQIYTKCAAHFEQLTQTLHLADVFLEDVCYTEQQIDSILKIFPLTLQKYLCPLNG